MTETSTEGFVKRTAQAGFDRFISETEREVAIASVLEKGVAAEIMKDAGFEDYFARKLIEHGDLPQDYFTKEATD